MQAFKLKVAPKFLLGVPGGRTVALATAGFIFSTMAAKYQDLSSATSLPLVSSEPGPSPSSKRRQRPCLVLSCSRHDN